MKIVIMAFGSRGDVQPFLALAVALRERGHHVTLAAPSDFEAQITAYRIAFLPIPINNMEVMQRDIGKRVASEGMTPRVMLALWRELIPDMKRALLTATHNVAEAARSADLLIGHGFLIPAAYAIHQHVKIPLILSIAAPILATRTYPNPMFPRFPFGGRFFYPLTHDLLVRMVTSFMIEPMNTYRRSVGLPTLSSSQIIRVLFSGEIPLLMHYSRHLMPPPPDWSANVHVVGAWALPALPDWTPPEKLSAFLAQGAPPVYVGFGSMPVKQPAQMVQTISAALRAAKLRGVLQAGWAGLAHEDDAHLITIGDAPHDWLFPRMAAIVHHGGSGTTHSALLAGKPALIVPYNADQPMWGRQIAALGVGVPPIRPKNLTPERLTEALITLTHDSAMQQRAADMGVLMRAENGLAAACDLVEHCAASG
jgi:sterol 3beta-glucosyltransferase